MKVLSVDDNSENLYLLENMLRSDGYEVVEAHNGVEALDTLQREPVDLVIADILMPQMDGFELCRQVKRREELRHIPFVFYTATYTDKKDEELGLRLGASRFIMKPVEPEEFLASIREVLRAFDRGGLPAGASPEEREAVLLKAYNQALVRKLGDKVEQLEHSERALRATLAEVEHEVSERRRAEAQVRQLNAELEQRVQARTAELRAANEQLEHFVAAVAHDLRTPLRSIDGYLHMLARAGADKLDDPARGHLAKLRTAAERMNQFLEACLDLAHATHSPLRREPVDLSQAAEKIIHDLRQQEPARAVDFTPQPGLLAQGDPALLYELLQNLLGNAWKFTARTRGARIEFGRAGAEDSGAYFVRDNGVGFSMDSAQKLFRPLQRLPSAEGFPGTGIGLATVQQIVRRHGGRLWAEAAPGAGATFHFTLG